MLLQFKYYAIIILKNVIPPNVIWTKVFHVDIFLLYHCAECCLACNLLLGSVISAKPHSDKCHSAKYHSAEYHSEE